MLAACKKWLRGDAEKERGEVMIEGMIIVTMTMFILIWLLGLGFLYYQRYVTTVVTNDVAVKIASTYNNPSSDVIMGYINTEDLSNRDLYRGFTGKSNSLRATNEDRATAYVKYMLDKANFANTVSDVDVDLELVADSPTRRHVKVTATCEYNTPFGAALELFGMSARSTYQVTACADCTDVADYISTINYAYTWTSGAHLEDDPFMKSILNLLNTFAGIFNKKYS